MAISESFKIPRSLYPFQDQWMPYGDGKIHYVDEGSGQTVLLLHGNPTWSFLYREIIKSLKSQFRVVAVDYPGFGMSTAPAGFKFTPQEQAAAVAHFIETLHLTDLILVVQDWGGPIGMSYATQHPEKMAGLVVMNSWAWRSSFPQTLFSFVMGGWPLGYWLQTRKNFFVRKILPHGFFHKEKVTAEVMTAYLAPFQTPSSRVPTWVFPRYIRKAGPWLEKLEAQLHVLAHVPAKILWGSKDEPGFRPQELARWKKHLVNSEVEILEDASHFVQEDRPDRVIEAIRLVASRS